MTAFGIDYRPKTLKKFLGNASVVDQLRGYEKKNSYPPAFLISGPTGSGKTTLIRIISNMILGGTDELIEINAGDENGIGMVRQIADVIKYKPRTGEKRVVAIDECHAITRSAATSLLKILEEPPSNVHWILATNRPENLLPELRNRTVYFKLQLPSKDEVVDLCLYVLKKNGVSAKSVDSALVEHIVSSCGNNPRLALNTLSGVYAAVESGSSWKNAVKSVTPELSTETKSFATVMTALLKRDTTPLLESLTNGTTNPFAFVNASASMLQYFLCRSMRVDVSVNPYFERMFASAKPSTNTVLTVMQSCQDMRTSVNIGGDPFAGLVTRMVKEFHGKDRSV